MHSNNKGVYFGYGNSINDSIWDLIKWTHIYLYIYPYPIIYSHLLIYSGTFAFYEIDCWFGNLFALSSVCLLGHNRPSIVLPPLTFGNHSLLHVGLLPYPLKPCLDHWPMTIHALTEPRLFLRLPWRLPLAEFSSTISRRWRGGTSHIQIGGHSTRQMFVNTVWFIYDIRISHKISNIPQFPFPVFYFSNEIQNNIKFLAAGE